MHSHSRLRKAVENMKYRLNILNVKYIGFLLISVFPPSDIFQQTKV